MNRSNTRNIQPIIIGIVVIGVIALALSGYLGTLFGAATSPFVDIQSWFFARYQIIYEFLTVPRDVASLRSRNAQLEEEVASLQTQVIDLQQQLTDTDVLYALLDFARARPENVYVAASVIAIDPNPFLQYIIIDRGSDEGLRHGMPVVTQLGLVGQVDAVTANAARIQLITDASSTVNARLKNAGVDAILSGSVTGDLELSMVDQDIGLEIGEIVLTSGLGGNYPQDVVIGQVVTIRKLENELFQTATIQPAVDFTKIKAVLVITNFNPVDFSPLVPTPRP
jgi:rod shape-determining protein MreC